MNQLSGEVMLLSTRLSISIGYLSESGSTHRGTFASYYKNSSTWNDQCELTPRGLWRFRRKLAKGSVKGLLQFADVAKEIYDHGSLVQATWSHFSPICIWISHTFHDGLDYLDKGMGISRRNIEKNYIGQKQICSLQSITVRQVVFHKFSAR